MTYTCTLTQGFSISWTAAPVLVDAALVRFVISDSAGRMRGCSAIQAIQCSDFDFQGTLTSVGPLVNGARDMTSTFRFTVTARLNGTVVECNGFTIHLSKSFLVACTCLLAAYISYAFIYSINNIST